MYYILNERIESNKISNKKMIRMQNYLLKKQPVGSSENESKINENMYSEHENPLKFNLCQPFVMKHIVHYFDQFKSKTIERYPNCQTTTWYVLYLSNVSYFSRGNKNQFYKKKLHFMTNACITKNITFVNLGKYLHKGPMIGKRATYTRT